VTIREYQDTIDTWIAAHGVRYFNELTNMALLTEEVGELSRLISREYGEQSFKPSSKPPDIKKAIAEEMADVLFVVGCIANQTGIDLQEAIDLNFQKKTSRDTDRHRNNPKLH